MKSYSVVLIIGVIVTFLYSVFHDLKLRKKRKQVLEELTIALMKGDNQKYETILSDNQGMFPRFNLAYLQLENEIAQNNYSNIRESLADFEQAKLNKKQKKALYGMLFNYFMAQGHYKEGGTCLKKLKEDGVTESVHQCEIMYDTLAENVSAYIDEVLKRVETEYGEKRLRSTYLLSKMYANQGDLLNARKYEQEVQENIIALLQTQA